MTTLHPIHLKIDKITHYWAKKGAKTNRHKQIQRMHTLANFAITRGANHIGQIGPRTLRAFQKANNLADSTMIAYRQAMRDLYLLSNLDAGMFGTVNASNSSIRLMGKTL